MALVLKSGCQGILSPKGLARCANSEFRRANNSLYLRTSHETDLVKLICILTSRNLFFFSQSSQTNQLQGCTNSMLCSLTCRQSGMWLHHLFGVPRTARVTISMFWETEVHKWCQALASPRGGDWHGGAVSLRQRCRQGAYCSIAPCTGL